MLGRGDILPTQGIYTYTMSACFSVDDTSRQTTALGVLVACMKSTAEKDTDPLHYIYQKYDVSNSLHGT